MKCDTLSPTHHENNHPILILHLRFIINQSIGNDKCYVYGWKLVLMSNERMHKFELISLKCLVIKTSENANDYVEWFIIQ